MNIFLYIFTCYDIISLIIQIYVNLSIDLSYPNTLKFNNSWRNIENGQRALVIVLEGRRPPTTIEGQQVVLYNYPIKFYHFGKFLVLFGEP